MRVLPFFKPKKGWHVAGTNLEPDSGGGSYVLPTASADTLGGVKVGDGLAINAAGVLSASGGGGGGSSVDFSSTEIEVGTFGNEKVYSMTISSVIENYATISSGMWLGNQTINFDKILFSSLVFRVGNNVVYGKKFVYDTSDSTHFHVFPQEDISPDPDSYVALTLYYTKSS